MLQVEDGILPETFHAGLQAPTCKPHFLLVKDRVVIGRVAGANAPDVVAQIVENAPAVEAD